MRIRLEILCIDQIGCYRTHGSRLGFDLLRAIDQSKAHEKEKKISLQKKKVFNIIMSKI
jgi:hypothetical protein